MTRGHLHILLMKFEKVGVGKVKITAFFQLDVKINKVVQAMVTKTQGLFIKSLFRNLTSCIESGEEAY
jgi:hypothetical protein